MQMNLNFVRIKNVTQVNPNFATVKICNANESQLRKISNI